MNFPYLNESGAINTYTVVPNKTTHTLSAANMGQVLICAPDAELTIAIPIGLPKNFYCAVLKVSDAFNVVLDPASGVTLSSATEEDGNSTISVDFQFVELVMWRNNLFVASGFGPAGIDLPAALAAKAPLSGPVFVDEVTLPATVLFNDGNTVYPILVGPADSGGTGFRMLRIANAS